MFGRPPLARALTPVVIGTHPDRKPWLNDCLSSIKATSSPRRTIHIHEPGGYEPAAIRAGCSKFERFLFIHDSVTILHRDFWNVVDTSGPAWLAGWPPMMLAIYDRASVEIHLPVHDVSKLEACHLEGSLPSVVPMPTIWPEVTDATHLRMEERHGRLNMVLGNHLWEKHKGYWGQ